MGGDRRRTTPRSRRRNKISARCRRSKRPRLGAASFDVRDRQAAGLLIVSQRLARDDRSRNMARGYGGGPSRARTPSRAEQGPHPRRGRSNAGERKSLSRPRPPTRGRPRSVAWRRTWSGSAVHDEGAASVRRRPLAALSASASRSPYAFQTSRRKRSSVSIVAAFRRSGAGLRAHHGRCGACAVIRSQTLRGPLEGVSGRSPR